MERFWWPRLRKDVRRYVQNCHSCQMNKAGLMPIAPLQPIFTFAPGEIVASDIKGPLSITARRSEYINYNRSFYKFFEAIPNQRCVSKHSSNSY